MSFQSGWEFRPDDIAASHERMASGGLLVASAGESFRGEWRRRTSAGETAFIACTVEQDRPAAFRQGIGDCVSMIHRSLEDCYNWDRVKNGGMGRPVRLCFEPIYAGSRIAIGRGQLGYGAGSVGAWAAEYLARYGVIQRGIYNGVDLSKPREDLAQQWGNPGVGVPDQIQVLGRRNRFKAHKCRDTDELADALAVGAFGGICRSMYCHRVDSEGFAIFDQPGGHHTSIRAGWVDRFTNRRVFGEQQTHGTKTPTDHPVAHTTDGDVELSDGMYPVRENDIARFMANGEVWVYQPVDGEEFR